MKRSKTTKGKEALEPQEDQPLEQVAAEYDAAAESYAEHHKQQQQTAAEDAGGGEGAGYGYGAETDASSFGDFSSYEETLSSLEQASAEFTVWLPYLRSLPDQEKTEYLDQWKEYLQQLAKLNAELILALERAVAACQRAA